MRGGWIMLVNNRNYGHVRFVSYDGRYPCLCSGMLVLDIDGTRYSFGRNGNFPFFWSSGGNCYFMKDEGENVTSGEWIINVNDIPEQFRQYASEIDTVFNSNVEHGCCGGCT